MNKLIHARSGDLVTVIFQGLGPFRTFLLMFLVGLCIQFLAWHTGLLWRAGNEPCQLEELSFCNKGYLLNISWSFTILILFPIIFYMVTNFYNNTYAVLDNIGNKALVDKAVELINKKWILLFYLLLPVLWGLYFYSIINSETWTWGFSPPSCNGKTNCSIIIEVMNEITLVGVLTTLYHILNGLFIICLIRAILLGKLIVKEVIDKRDTYSFAHPDGVYGLSKIRNYLKDVYIIISLLTIYIIIYVLDKSLIQEELSNALVIATVYIAAWVLFVYLIQTTITEPIGKVMRDNKEKELIKLQSVIEGMSSKGRAYNDLWETKVQIEALPENIFDFKYWKTMGATPFISLVVSPGVLNYIKGSSFYSAFSKAFGN